jgi:hypothetical protein
MPHQSMVLKNSLVSNDINAKSIQKRILKLFTNLYIKIYIALYELTNKSNNLYTGIFIILQLYMKTWFRTLFLLLCRPPSTTTWTLQRTVEFWESWVLIWNWGWTFSHLKENFDSGMNEMIYTPQFVYRKYCQLICSIEEVDVMTFCLADFIPYVHMFHTHLEWSKYWKSFSAFYPLLRFANSVVPDLH